MDGRTPASLHRLPNAEDAYCPGSTGRRKSHVGQLQVFVKGLNRCFPAKGLARPGVESQRHGLQGLRAVSA